MAKGQITVMITDFRKNGTTGPYHNQALTLFKITNNKKDFLFCKYGKMKTAEKANAEIKESGRVSIYGEVSGKDGDIHLGEYKFRYAINQLGLDVNEETLEIIKYIDNNG